jgi:hypothetical protein
VAFEDQDETNEADDDGKDFCGYLFVVVRWRWRWRWWRWRWDATPRVATPTAFLPSSVIFGYRALLKGSDRGLRGDGNLGGSARGEGPEAAVICTTTQRQEQEP